MNNPDDLPTGEAFQAEMLAWLQERKVSTGKPWSAIADESGIPKGSVSQMGIGVYKGNLDNAAKLIFRYKQKVESQAAQAREALARPKFIATKSAKRVLLLLERAQYGRITVAAMGPGTGKTMSAEFYASSVANAWMITGRQSSSSVTAMLAQIMAAMKLHNTIGWKHQRSAQIIDFARNREGVLIVDEANHYGLDALEELRGLHDATGMGLALLGNEELMARIQGGQSRHAYARLNSRIAGYHIQDLPDEDDVSIYLDEMNIDELAMRRPLIDTALSTSSGGLREVQQILEFANLLAIQDEKPMSAEHVQTAMANRATSQMRSQRRRAA